MPTCSGLGTNAFVGGADANNALGSAAGVLSGGSNDACDDYSVIVGGLDSGIGADSNASTNAFIGAGFLNIITTAADAFIGAGEENVVSAQLGFIGAGVTNTVSAFNSAVVAGSSNTSSSTNGFIGAGYTNAISARSNVIAGGEHNSVSGDYSVITGGSNNIAVGQYAVIGGGSINRTPGQYATVPGGYGNYASGFGSFAGGDGSAAVNIGAFVWSDSAGGTRLVSSASNQFLAKASGGVKFFSNKTLTTGVMLGAGSGTWASVSDRAVKTNVAAIDDAGILDKVASLPISEWSYISERGVRHVGPMAQDFYAAFGVGADNKHITSIDEDGVALAAIKALHSENATLRMQLAQEKTQRQLQKAQLDSEKINAARMERQLQKLSADVAALHTR